MRWWMIGGLGCAGLLAVSALWLFNGEECRASLRGPVGSVECVAASPTGLFAAGGAGRTIHLWRMPGRWEAALTGHTARVEAVALSADGTRLASGSADGILKVWDVAGRQERHSVAAHRGGVSALVFSPDGSILYSGGADRLIRAREAGSGKELFILKGHTGSVRSLALSPDGRWLASAGGGDNRPRLWAVGKPGPAKALPFASRRRVHCLTFVAGGKVLAIADRDGHVRLWDVDAGRERASWQAHDGPVTGLAEVDNGLVSVSEAGELVGWSMAGERHGRKRNRTATNALAVGDARTLISADADGRVRLWSPP